MVDEVGDAVQDVSVGDAVFGFAAGGAGAAQLSLVADYFPIPRPLTFVQAASLPVAVETAARTLDLLGRRLRGNAGGQRCGRCGRQLGGAARGRARCARDRHRKSRTTTTICARSERRPQPTATGSPGASRELAPGGVDFALDAFGGGALPELVELTGNPERVVTIADYQAAQETGARFSGGPGTDRALYALREIGELIEADGFSLPVAQTFPLERIGEAHELSQAGHVRGKLVLVVD